MKHAFGWPVKTMGFGLAVLLTCGVIGQEKASPEGREKAKSESSEALPSAKAVLQKYMDAIGGEEAFAKHKSQHAIGTVEMPGQQLKGKLEVYAARPNKLLVIIGLPGIGEVTTGFNGEVGWMSNPLTGPMLLPESMVNQLAAQADFDHALHHPDDYTKLEMLGLEEFGGEPCYKLQLVHKTGFESTEFFSKETGLQKGFISAQESPLGKVNVTTLVTNYKKFNGILMASSIVQKMSGMEQRMEIEKMEFDTVPASKFELPPDIKALAQPEKEPAAAEKKPAPPAAGGKAQE